jgi:flagellar biosynthesis protein FlhF
MKIVRYKARTKQEAWQQIRAELGPDAVIISTRLVSPWLRWFGREHVEVVAAAGAPTPRRSAPVGDASPAASAVAGAHEGRADERAREVLADAVALASANGQRRATHPANADARRRSTPEVADLQREIREIREALGRLMTWTAPKDDAAELLVTQLLERGLSEKLARDLVGAARDDSGEATWEGVRAAIAERIEVMGGADLLVAAGMAPEEANEWRDSALPGASGDGPLVVALVGPTGVGKTTTVAKLAARHAILDRRAVALVTLDTYRVAAVDQIRTYAQMLDVPLEVVVSPEDVRPALDRHANKELIFIDTIGHGPNDEMQLGQLRMLLSAMAPDQVHLVLAAPTDRHTMLNALERFSRLKPTHLLFTKLDEAVFHGAMVETAIRSGWPVSYVSYGQDVPEKIAPATVDELAAAICPEED